MVNINIVFNQLSEVDKRKFKTFLEQKNKRKDVKNIVYFQMLVKGELTDKEIKEHLYPDGNYGAYHGLRKRIIDDFVLFMINDSDLLQQTDETEINQLILVSRQQLLVDNNETGFFLLKKAEKKANHINDYLLLHQIYHLHLQFVHKNPNEHVNQLIEKSKLNQLNLIKEEKFTRAYALAKQHIQDMYHKNDIQSIEIIIEQVFRYCNIDKVEDLSYKSIYQLSSILTQYADFTKDFFSVKNVLIELYGRVLYTEKSNQAVYHIHVLYLISNLFFRLKDFEKSLTYIHQLEHILRLNPTMKTLFSKKISCLKALNHHFSGDSALGISGIKKKIKIKSIWKTDELNLALSGIMMFIQTNQLDEAHLWLSNFKHRSKWYIDKMGIDWVIQKHFMEIILNIELGKIDLVDLRLKHFERNYKAYLSETNQERVLIFLDLVKSIYYNPEIATNKTFFEKVEHSFDWKLPEEEDIFVMSCFAWMKSKMTRQDLYETTLNLVRKQE